MATVVPVDTLRDHIAEALAINVKAYNVPTVCVRLAIQSTVEEGDAAEAQNSKRVYVKNRLLAKEKAELLQIAERVLEEYASTDLSETVSEMSLHADQRVSQLVRRDVLKAINPVDALFGELPLLDCLREVFGAVIDHDETFGLLGRESFAQEIVRHCVSFPGDWSHEELLTRCGALTCSQTRFFALIEKLLHPLTRRDVEQGELAAAISLALKRDGFEVRQLGAESGYAIFGVVPSRPGVAGAMKNLIFASIGEKPELVFRDAVNNAVEIVKHADKVLVYDRPLPSSGLLLWRDLQDWWAQTHGLGDPALAKDPLYRRLLQAVRGARSAGEYAIFHGYYKGYGALLGDRLPALVPQVYLHYDPYTRRERGDEKYLVRQRMDFLLMLDHGVRIVIEVDGRHHYAVPDAGDPSRYIADAKSYAEMVAEDRRLKLMGYEVYRFGGREFVDVDLESWAIGKRAQEAVREFFDRLLKKHHVL
ncbi:hypothetical protein P3W85_00450 [Cupriavidus basilensis]|uniref:AbiJ-NTD3 domain-containing protein n=1 Tax=Cupriavidus basilensis TaxID=68895 RepID=A0ABT6AFQ6_9BURK|nr:hypothetical protein [Cupriavidus basilensis]MDF3831438.1 hypothetical protein [Cupriavidus basilensis]